LSILTLASIKQFQTELLVDAFDLPIVASSTTEAASGDGKAA
jgi:hypothetical protein